MPRSPQTDVLFAIEVIDRKIAIGSVSVELPHSGGERAVQTKIRNDTPKAREVGAVVPQLLSDLAGVHDLCLRDEALHQIRNIADRMTCSLIISLLHPAQRTNRRTPNSIA